jgi:hypothetical protein
MSNILAKFAFALFVVLASLAVSFAQQAGFAPTRNVPITTLGSRGGGNAYKAAQQQYPRTTVQNLFIPAAFAGLRRISLTVREFSDARRREPNKVLGLS